MRIYKPNEEISVSEYFTQKYREIEKIIKNLKTDYILNVNQEEYINMLVVKNTVSFEIYYDTERRIFDGEQEKQEEIEKYSGFYGHSISPKYREYKFCLKYKFSGDIDVLRIQPDCFSFSTLYNPIPIDVFGDELSISFSSRDNDSQIIENQISEIKKNAFWNLDKPDGAKWHINSFNEQLPQEIKKIFERVKAEKAKEHRMLIELGIDNLDSTTIEVPILKRITPIPRLLENKMVSYQIKDEIYNDILKHIYTLCKGYEQHENIYNGKHEESLRDLIVPSLNSTFIGTNSSAETFNRKGKTDIITKAPDNSSIFIAECKVWRGEKVFIEAIDQLLGYVTWRDTRTAIILFVKNGDISDIIEKARLAMTKHPCYVKDKGQTNESSFSYTYHINGDNQSHIALELMIFHYPEEKQ